MNDFLKTVNIQKDDASSVVFSVPSCSVLIKKTPDDILVGHATWHVYQSMSYRMLKAGAGIYHDTAALKPEFISQHKYSLFVTFDSFCTEI